MGCGAGCEGGPKGASKGGEVRFTYEQMILLTILIVLFGLLGVLIYDHDES